MTKPLSGLVEPIRPVTRLAVALQAVASVAEVVPYVAITELARRLVAGETTGLGWIATALIVALGVRAVTASTSIILTHLADIRLQSILRRRIVSRLAQVGLGWFTDHSSGHVRKAAQDDVAAIHYLVAHRAVEATAAITVPVTALGYLAVLDWRLALVALLPLPLYDCALAVMMRGAGSQMERMDSSLARVGAATVEQVAGMQVLKTFGQTGRASDSYVAAVRDHSTFFRGWVQPMVRLESVASMLLAPAPVLLLNLMPGIWLASSGAVSAVEVVAASMIGLVVPAAVLTLTQGMQAKVQAEAAALRLAGLLETPVLPRPVDPRTPSGHVVEIDSVSFAHEQVPVLHDVSMRLEPGTVTALVGPSGSGKSTLAGLLLRFQDVDAGVVRIGGIDVRDLEVDVLYEHVGFVLQGVQLVSGTVAENIGLGDPGAPRAAIERAARAAQIHDRIIALHGGYDALVGDEVTFSGGEAQRIAIARAILRDAPILVLDEATAFADPDTEAAVQDALAGLLVGRTVLVVAHRLQTIVDVDQIIVMREGRVVERGVHAELLGLDGEYARQWAAMQEATR